MQQRAICWLGLIAYSLWAPAAWPTPGEYALHVKIGPSFEVQDSQNSFKVGGEFDYELGYGFGFNLATQVGISDDPLFQLIPAVKYNLVYFVPATLYMLAGAGLELYNFEDQALGVRLGSGIVLPMRKPWEFITDVNFFFTPSGVPGNPITFDWLIGIGMRY